jgi:predicted type IV restriction endonuclease
MSQLKVLMDSIQDQMDFARRSLEESQRWYDMLQKRSDSEIADSEEEEDIHEPHEFGSTNPRFKPKQDEKPARSPSPVKPYNNELILAKIEAVKGDIQKLHKRILYERLTRCVMRIGTISYHTRMIAKVAEEKRLAARQLWHGQRVFTQEVQDLENCLREGYQRLTVAECESERLRTEIEQGKKATAKLAHWQDIHLHAADRIVKDIEALSVGRDVNVDKLLATLAQRHEELDALNAEHEEFDREYEFSVREPTLECERVQRTIYRTVEEKINLRKQIGAEEAEDHEEVNFAEICEMNRQLRLENDEMRREVSELEKNVANRGVDQARYMTALFAPPRTSRVSGVYRLPAKVKRPEMTPRGQGKSKFSRVQFD